MNIESESVDVHIDTNGKMKHRMFRTYMIFGYRFFIQKVAAEWHGWLLNTRDRMPTHTLLVWKDIFATLTIHFVLYINGHCVNRI